MITWANMIIRRELTTSAPSDPRRISSAPVCFWPWAYRYTIFRREWPTLAAALEDLNLGLVIAVAIAIHNIPEGLAISASIYSSQGSHRTAFFWSFLSGVSEIAGAGLGALILLPILTEQVMGFCLAAVAGTMVLISIDEIIPTAKSLASEHMPIVGVICGMIVVMLSLWALG